jgi:hypothetical protein
LEVSDATENKCAALEVKPDLGTSGNTTIMDAVIGVIGRCYAEDDHTL